MFASRGILVGVLLGLGCCLLIAATGACDRGGNLGGLAPNQAGSTGLAAAAGDGVSEGRKNAARLIVPGSTFLVDLLQRDPTDLTQSPCYPLGDPGLGFTKWPSRLHNLGGFPITVTSNFLQSEYDRLQPPAPPPSDTENVLSVRVGEPSGDPHFSQVEFNFRAVNPYQAAHVAGGSLPHYLMHEADYPSNDAVLARRSLIDLAGSDIAILIQGLDFAMPAPGPGVIPDTTAWMNYLGPFAWVAFMRDNAYQSGRFYAILGGMTGAPRALTDTPNPFDDGFFQSVQIRGDSFDAISEMPSHLTTPLPTCHVCPDFSPAVPTMPYVLLDYSNYNEAGAPTPGRGGFVFVMRSWAFSPVVVLDPSANPGQPPTPGNVIPPSGSGYAEAALHAAGLINHPTAVDHVPPDGLPGVHELSVSVFFIHTW